MSQVKIGPKFFSNELKVYRDWSLAFWRENLQNSFDAGANRIDITIRDGATEDSKVVVVSDNGSGMTKDVLENVYFTLGETTKTGNSVGGFGKARILTCFAQKGYTLHTGKLLVSGVGADYVIGDINFAHNGVKLEIEVYHKGVDLVAELKRYLKHCHLEGCTVTINGERWTDWTYKNKFERNLSFGKIFTNKSKHAGILVRVNGVHMFKPYTSAPFLVIVEIDKEKSREVLQSSRDGLLGSYQDELESFINEVNINKQSALREKRSKSIMYEGSGTFVSNRSKNASPEQVADSFEALLNANGFQLEGTSLRDAIVKSNDPAATAQKMIEKIRADGTKLEYAEPVIKQAQAHNHGGYDIENDRHSLNFDLFSTIVVDKTTNPKVRKVIESYYPNNWDLLGQVGFRRDRRFGGEARSFRAGVEKYKLLIMWKAACEFCIRLLQDELQVGGDVIPWGVGWYFTDPTPDNKALAAFRYNNGINWLMLNPTTPHGTMRISLSNKRDMIRLISDAAHEVCHIIYGDHDEQFANLLNNLLEECMAHLNDIINFIKQSKDEANARLDRLAEAA